MQCRYITYECGDNIGLQVFCHVQNVGRSPSRWDIMGFNTVAAIGDPYVIAHALNRQILWPLLKEPLDSYSICHTKSSPY